jgi:hypothetical protein
MRPSTLKVVGFNILAFALVGVGLFTHYLQPIFINDISHLTYVIAATMLSIAVFSVWDCFFPQVWIRSFIRFEEANLRLLGLIGTLVGLGFLVSIMFAASQQGAADGDSISHILVAFTAGLRTSFNPTLVGIVSWYWTRHLLYFTRNERY